MPVKSHRKPASKQLSLLPRALILVGIALVLTALLFLKNQPSSSAPTAGEPPQTQLDRLIQQKKPAFVFYHSNNCQSCLDMIAVVNQVYPEFQEKVTLVDVDVYDPVNESLLRRARINTIPTQVFYNAAGQTKMTLGVMQPAALRQQLQVIAGSAP